MPQSNSHIYTRSTQYLSQYDYTKTLDKRGWAWEFLRRNPAYYEHWLTGRAMRPAPCFHQSGAKIYRIRGPCLSAKRWGLFFLINPELDGKEADIFWRPEADFGYIKSRIKDSSPGSFDLSNFLCRRSVLITHEQREFLMFRRRDVSVGLMSSGVSMLHGPVRTTFEVEGIQDISRATKVLGHLRRLARPARYTHTTQHWSATTLRLRNFLVALDGTKAGLSHREVAVSLYGTQQTEEAWKSPNRSIKDRVRRFIQRGQELMNGAYLSLLK